MRIRIRVGLLLISFGASAQAADVPFESQPEISTAADGDRSVFAANVDGDGDLDVLSASNDDDTIAWYKNMDGAGTFASQPPICAATKGAKSVFAADRDGLRDLDETDTGIYVPPTDTGTDPFDPDSDEDGYSDYWEARLGSNPNQTPRSRSPRWASWAGHCGSSPSRAALRAGRGCGAAGAESTGTPLARGSPGDAPSQSLVRERAQIERIIR